MPYLPICLGIPSVTIGTLGITRQARVECTSESRSAVFLSLRYCAPPTPVFENLRLSGATFSKTPVRWKLDELEDAGYVEKILESKGYYQITDEGRRYVEGEIDSHGPVA